MPMLLVEVLATTIVVIYAVACGRSSASPRRFFIRFASVAVAAAITENTCIQLYGFYAYDPSWNIFVGRVPVLVVLIWPCLIDSAWQIASHLREAGRPSTVLLAAAIVLADASLIEPVAVQAMLWRWNEPGFLGVPPIGVLGWALFALGGLAVFQINDRHRRSARWDWIVLLAAPAFTHLALLSVWWGGLSTLSAAVPWPPTVALVWLVSAALTATIIVRPWGRLVPFPTMLLRIGPTLFFFALLATHGAPSALWLYAVAFAPPYLALTFRAMRAPRPT